MNTLIISARPSLTFNFQQKWSIEQLPVNNIFCPLQFRYATAFDLLLMVVGTISAIAHGAAFPLVTFILGEVTDAFVNYAATQTYAEPNNATIMCATSAVVDLANVTFNDARVAVSSNLTTGTADCNADAFGVSLEDILQTCFSNNGQCLSNDEFFDTINKLVYGFVGIAVGALIAGFAQISFFQLACERQVKRIRLHYYRSVLRQNIGWFDANPTGELSSRLSE